MEAAGRRFVNTCLTGLALALLLVGVVSGTSVRHVVQILPIIAALALLRRRPAWGAYAAIPLFLFWTFIVILIWLFLLGYSRIANGHYTPIEVLLTFMMAACSIAGVVRSLPLGRPVPLMGRVLVFVSFAAIQLAAMWVSFLRPLASR